MGSTSSYTSKARKLPARVVAAWSGAGVGGGRASSRSGAALEVGRRPAASRFGAARPPSTSR